MQYEIAEQADEEIANHYIDGIQRFGFNQAKAFFSELHNQFDLLASQPHMGVSFHKDKQYKKWGHGPYVVLYKIYEQENKIIIARVIDGRSE